MVGCNCYVSIHRREIMYLPDYCIGDPVEARACFYSFKSAYKLGVF